MVGLALITEIGGKGATSLVRTAKGGRVKAPLLTPLKIQMTIDHKNSHKQVRRIICLGDQIIYRGDKLAAYNRRQDLFYCSVLPNLRQSA